MSTPDPSTADDPPPRAADAPELEVPGAPDGPESSDAGQGPEMTDARDLPEVPASAPVVTAPADPGTAAVRLDGVTRRFGDDVGVEGISFAVAPGTILGVIGPSGAGKTTTIRMLTGALAPSEGTVQVLGEDPVRFRRQTRQRIGYMPQQFTLYRDLSARENVDFVASLFGLLWRTRHRRTREVLQLVELWDARSRRAGDLSGGMQRRLELACALVHQPSLLFLDEPTAGIDPILRQTIWEELHRLRDDGRTLLVTTQYVNEAEACDQVALIAEGRLVALAPPDELRRQAVGGDLIEIELAGPFDVNALRSIPAVRSVRTIDAETIRVTVDDAAAALPDVVDAVRGSGTDAAGAREIRPSFDEVFATLVQRARDAGAQRDDETAA